VIVQTNANGGPYYTETAIIDASGIASGQVGDAFGFEGEINTTDFQAAPQNFPGQSGQCGGWTGGLGGCTRSSGDPETTTWSGNQIWLDGFGNPSFKDREVSPSIITFSEVPMVILASTTITCLWS
jgi:hypothetical protein